MNDLKQTKAELKELKEKMKIIEDILGEFLMRDAYYPDSAVAAEMIMRIQVTSGDDKFVGDLKRLKR